MIKNLLRCVNTEIDENVQIVGFLTAVGRTNSFTQQHSFFLFPAAYLDLKLCSPTLIQDI